MFIFDNIGKKIKILAFILCVLGMLSSLFGGIYKCLELGDHYATEDYAVLALLIIPFGCLLSWISAFTLYGFGELVDQTTKIRELLEDDEDDIEAKKKKLMELRTKNLITQEEFDSKMAALLGVSINGSN